MNATEDWNTWDAQCLANVFLVNGKMGGGDEVRVMETT